jgi:hypothetical protein
MDVINESQRRRVLPLRSRRKLTVIVCCLAAAFGTAAWHCSPRAPASSPISPCWFHFDDGPFDEPPPSFNLSEEAAKLRAAKHAGRITELKRASNNACPQGGDAAGCCADGHGTRE